MNPSTSVSFFLNKWIFRSFLALAFGGLLLFLRFPDTLYSSAIEFISTILKEKYGTGGSKIKIDLGLHKLGFLLIASGLLLFSVLSFWKWLIKISPAGNLVPFLSTNIKLNKKDWIFISIIGLIAILLRMFPLSQSLWQDEIGVYETFIKNGIATTIFPKNSMGSQPLMQILVALFTQVVGVTEVTLRLPLFFIAIASIPLIYIFTLKLTQSKITALIACFFLSIHSYHIYYSFQMRGYGILVFMCMISCYYLIKLMENQDKKTRFWYILSNVIIVYTHLYSVYLLLAQHLVIVMFQLHNYYVKKNKENYFSQEFMLHYFHCFLISILWIIALYVPQIPVIFMNILATASSNKSMLNYFEDVVHSLNYMVAYSSFETLSAIFLGLLLFIYIFTVEKTRIFKIINAIALVLFILTALIPSGTGFFPRYLICEIPLLIFIIAITISNLWKSNKFYLKFGSFLLFFGFIFINLSGYELTYQKIQDYKGAVAYVKNYPSSKPKLIVANSLGKSEVKYYDSNIIALNDVNELDSLLLLHYDVFAITTYESFAGKSLFKKDKETQAKIEKIFEHEKIMEGEFPVNVWHYPKKQ